MRLNSVIFLNCRQGIIQPSVLGEDGRPKPASHILELLETLPNTPPTEDSEDN